MRYKLTIEYDGRSYHGWQRLPDAPSVQGALEDAVEKLTGIRTDVTGAGRTDSGVHAYAQVAHVDIDKALQGWQIVEALNAHIRPHPISVLNAEEAAPDFHARFDATARAYTYELINRRSPLALDLGRAWRIGRPLDVRMMDEAAQVLRGNHDFTTFRDTKCQAKSPVKTLDIAEVESIGEQVMFHFEARSFLHSQVRSMVGTLVEVGLGKMTVEEVAAALAAADRTQCGPVAPPDGLYLVRVDYAAK
ncbi:MAG: tRNA pseudouridine(38-40) synthase TruA [Alphaproteobacteria bacterium]|nr:tRNA pseudouridine(38-40) synthase TruA [Alphaproteobacteria bacterium]